MPHGDANCNGALDASDAHRAPLRGGAHGDLREQRTLGIPHVCSRRRRCLSAPPSVVPVTTRQAQAPSTPHRLPAAHRRAIFGCLFPLSCHATRHPPARDRPSLRLTLARPTEAQDASAPVRTSADSSYTDAQAERGRAALHPRLPRVPRARRPVQRRLPAQVGGQTTFDLFKNISTTMPDNNPGMLANRVRRRGGLHPQAQRLPAGPADSSPTSTVLSRAKMTLPGRPAPGTSPPSGATACSRGRASCP
jgi:hypothetical protein